VERLVCWAAVAPCQHSLGEIHVPFLYDRYDESDDVAGTERPYLRAGVRVNSRVKVAVESKDEGEARRAEGHTMDISAYGCMAIVPAEFAVGDAVTLTNLANEKKCEAVLVWRGHQGTSGWELGLQLKQPSADFWDLEF
jgi:hypothetical protein